MTTQSATTSTPWASLQNENYINLTTFRKNGEGVATPVWFAELNGKLVVYTVDNTGKVKRIRNNGRVEVAACNARGNQIHGPVLQGHARILPLSEADTAEHVLNRKYFMKRFFNLFARLRKETRAYIEISPA